MPGEGRFGEREGACTPATIPSKSTTGLLPSTTLNPSSTHGRYGAVKLKMPRKLSVTYWCRRPHTYTCRQPRPSLLSLPPRVCRDHPSIYHRQTSATARPNHTYVIADSGQSTQQILRARSETGCSRDRRIASSGVAGAAVTIMNVRDDPKNCTLTKGATSVSSVPPAPDRFRSMNNQARRLHRCDNSMTS